MYGDARHNYVFGENKEQYYKDVFQHIDARKYALESDTIDHWKRRVALPAMSYREQLEDKKFNRTGRSSYWEGILPMQIVKRKNYYRIPPRILYSA